MYKTKDSELVAFLRISGHAEDSVSLEPDLKGKIKVYFLFKGDGITELAQSFDASQAVGNIRAYISEYKKVIDYVLGVMGTGKPK